MKIGVNLEFVREADMPFRQGIEKAEEIGYDYVEPCLSTGYDLLAEAGYYHMVSMEEDPLEYREMTDELGLTVEGVSAHAPLMKPEASVNWLKRAVEWVDAWGGHVVNTDEGPRPEWLTDDEFAFEVMKYTLTRATQAAERHGVTIALEPHQEFSQTAETFHRLMGLVDSDAVGINYDTGNAYLQGNDPVGYLKALGPEHVVHLHAKDISLEQSEEERGEVTGTPVGCAVGEGLVEWPEVFDVLESAGFDGVVSVECGDIDEAERSYEYLTDLASEYQMGRAVADD